MVESLLQRWVCSIRRDFEEMSTNREEGRSSKRKQRMLPNKQNNVVGGLASDGSSTATVEMDNSRLQAIPAAADKREDSFEMILLTLYNICIVVLLETLNLLPSKFSFAVTPSTTDRFESRGIGMGPPLSRRRVKEVRSAGAVVVGRDRNNYSRIPSKDGVNVVKKSGVSSRNGGAIAAIIRRSNPNGVTSTQIRTVRVNHAAYRIIASRSSSSSSNRGVPQQQGGPHQLTGNGGTMVLPRRRTRSYPETAHSAAKRRFLNRRRSCPLMTAQRLATVREETAEELENC